MTTELRAALADLASEAPKVDVAASAIARGRARRRRAVAGVATACAVAVIGGTAAVTALRTAPESLPSAPPAGQVMTFDPNVVVNPWGWGDHDLPSDARRAGRHAADRQEPHCRHRRPVACSRSPAGAHIPAVTPDGTTLAWWDIDDQELVIRDLSDGSEQRQPAEIASDFDGVKTAFEAPMWWSPDGATLAVTGEDGSLTLVDRATGDATELRGRRIFRRLAWVGPGRRRRLCPGVRASRSLRSRSTDQWRRSGRSSRSIRRSRDVTPTLSPDGKTLAWYESHGDGSSDVMLTLLTLSSGARYQLGCECVATNRASWTPDGRELLKSTAPGPTIFGTTQEANPGFKPVLALSPRLGDTSLVTFAGGVSTEGVPAPHSRWWYGWYLDWITYAVAALALLLGAALVRHRRRRDAGRRAYREAFGRDP